MKVTKEKAAENRELILGEAARLFRERGATGVGVDALTEAAGLTHGSLYSQFGSKDKLLAESLRDGYAKIVARAAGVGTIQEVIARYVSERHRDNPGTGCFMAALGCDMPRQSDEVRRSFTEIVKGSMGRIGRLLPGRRKQREDEALMVIATMVGAVVLARAVDDVEFSDRILAASRRGLLLQEKGLKLPD